MFIYKVLFFWKFSKQKTLSDVPFSSFWILQFIFFEFIFQYGNYSTLQFGKITWQKLNFKAKFKKLNNFRRPYDVINRYAESLCKSKKSESIFRIF